MTTERQPLPDVGTVCDNPVADARVIADLEWHDGPILAVQRAGDDLYLRGWFDQDDRSHRWAVVRITRARLEAFLRGDVTLMRVFSECEDGRVYMVDNDGATVHRCAVVSAEEYAALDGFGDEPSTRWHERPTAADMEGAR